MLGDGDVVTGWGSGARSLLGYDAAEVVGRPLPELLFAEPPSEHAAELSGAALLRHRDGHPVPMEISVDAADPGTPQLRRVLVAQPLGTGLADPHLLERAIDQFPIAVGVHDADLRFVCVSRELRRLLDLPEDDVQGRRLSEMHPSKFYREVDNRMARVVRSGRASVRNVRHTPPGETSARSWVVWFSPLRDARGRVTGVVAAMLDDTSQYWARTWLDMLSEAGTRVGTSLDVTKTAQELTEVIVPKFADLATVDLLDAVLTGSELTPAPFSQQVTLRRVAQRAEPADTPFGVRLDDVHTYPDFSPVSRCLALGRGVLSGGDEPGFTRWIAQSPERTESHVNYGMNRMIAVPLRARGTLLGVLMCVRSRPEHFAEGHLRVAEELAARAALSLDNARRYTRERNTAVLLQRSLLPNRPPELAAVDVASRYLPYLSGDAEIGVGGDWYDVIPLSGGRVALAVGDVVGHGVHASATMARLRGAVRTLADVDLPPDELLTHLDDIVTQLSGEADDEALAESGDGETGATCLYTVYDPVTRRYTIASAGHPPPIVASPGAAPEILVVPTGPPLGVGGVPFESMEVELPPDSTLVLYTDGLIESRENDPEDGLARLRESMTESGAGLEDLCDSLLDAMLTTQPSDDVALLVARTHALDPDQVATWDVPVDPAIVGEMRAQATRRLSDWGLDDLAFTTELIVSELVTNAIRYGSAPIRLRLILDQPRRRAGKLDGTLICEVYDGGETAPHVRRAHAFDEGGRGLMLVAALSRRWGSRPVAGGKTIWCEQQVELSRTGDPEAFPQLAC